MTGATRAAHLVWYAREVLREARESHARQVHNGAVRRSQECLEMCLKAVLLQLGVDCPREHDVGALVVNTVELRGLKLPRETLEALATASHELAAKRAPALYAEILCTAEEASAAVDAAEAAFALAVTVVG
jgi:HEPN domain-containing protein